MTAKDRVEVVYPATELRAIERAGRRRVTRRFGRVMVVLLLLVPFALAFAPWQQNLPGVGRVIEYDPVNRPMPLQARTDGLIRRWHVQEGQLVEQGDPIVDLADNDPRILENLAEQLAAAEEERDAARRKRDQLELLVAAAEQGREAPVQHAADGIAAAEQALVVAERAVEVARETLSLAEFVAEMWAGLVADRIGPGVELQKARQQLNIARVDVAAKEAAVLGAEADLRAKKSARKRVERAELVKVQDAKAKSDAAAADVAKAEGTIPGLRRDLERQRQQQLTAPIDGYVQNLSANGQGGGFVKAGTTLATLVPATSQLAVELYIDGNDVTFIDVGRHVRLQFEGWHAIQGVGGPSAAIGTVGGKVAFIDRFDDGSGRFRVMVLPDERPFIEPEGPIVDWLRSILTFEKVSASENPHAWPGAPYLRQGAKVKGWIVLDRVSLGFEIWRQLNGFPPTIDRPEQRAPTPGDGEATK